jgi:membrane protease YdiL (CAAX protease family)
VVVGFLMAVILYVSASGLVIAVSVLSSLDPAQRNVQGLLQAITHLDTSKLLDANLLVRSALAGSSVFAACALIGGALSRQRLRDRLQLRPSGLGTGGVALVCVGLFALALAIGSLLDLLHLTKSGPMDVIAGMVRDASPGLKVAAVVAIGLGAGTGEELFFRGFLQTRLAARYGAAAAIVVTSLAFAFIHLNAVQGCFAFAAGLWLGWVAVRTGSIWPCIAAHVFSNSISTVLMTTADPTSRGAGRWVAVGLGTAIWVGCWRLLRRRMTSPPSPQAAAA